MIQRCFVWILLIFVCATSYAQIIEIAHFREVESYIDPGTLVILDIDDTLLIPEQMLGCDEWFMSCLSQKQKEGASASVALEKTLAEWEAVRHITKMQLCEAGTAEIVEKMQQDYCVMALTTQGLALATRTCIQLKENGIDMSRSAPSSQDQYHLIDGHGVLYRQGILFTSGQKKGRSLFAVCDTLNYRPSKIVFVNDKASHLADVEDEADIRGIEFIGLRYAYSDARKQKYSDEIADYQFSHSSFKKIVSDEEACAALSRP